jgi:hypothetical protein
MLPDSVNPEMPVEIIAMIKVSGSPWLQEQLRSRCRELINIFSTSVRSLPAQVDPMVIEIDRTKWEAPRNRLFPRHHSAEKQLAIRTQINKLLELGVIKELQASTYGRWSMAIDPRLVQLNAVTQVPDGSWCSIPVDTGCYVNKVLNGFVYEICEIYIDDVLIHGKSEAELLRDVRQVFERLRAKTSLSTPSKINLVSQRSNTSVTSSPRQAPHSPHRSD